VRSRVAAAKQEDFSVLSLQFSVFITRLERSAYVAVQQTKSKE
jgi:hypothetical protein